MIHASFFQRWWRRRRCEVDIARELAVEIKRKRVSRHDLVNIAPQGPGRGHESIEQKLGESFRGYNAVSSSGLQQRSDFRREGEPSSTVGPVERLDTHRVAREDHAASYRVV